MFHTVLLDMSDILSCMPEELKGTDRLWEKEKYSTSLTAEEMSQLRRAREVLSEDIKLLNNTQRIKKIVHTHAEKPILVALYPPNYEPDKPKFTPYDIAGGYVAAVVGQIDEDRVTRDEVWIGYGLSVYEIKKGINLDLTREGRVPTQARYDLMGVIRETMADGTFQIYMHDEREMNQFPLQQSNPTTA